MPLTRGEAVGYDAELMAFKFTMGNGERIVQCQISHAALSDLACHGSRAAAREMPAQFEAHRELIEAIASAQGAYVDSALQRRSCSSLCRVKVSELRRRRDLDLSQAMATSRQLGRALADVLPLFKKVACTWSIMTN